MEQEVFLKDILPYIQAWTFSIALILLVFIYRIWRFGKKYPEIFQPDTTAEDKQKRQQKARLQRQYHNTSMLSLSIIFVWMIGMVAICFGFNGSMPTAQGWFLLVFAICAILWVLSLMRRNPKE